MPECPVALIPARELYEEGPSFSGRGFRVERVDYANGYRRGPHAHDTTGITLVVDGHIRERAHGVEELASPLSVVIKPAGTVHENEVGPRGARTIAVDIIDTEELLGNDHRLGPWRWSHGGPGVQPLLALGRVLLDPDAGFDPEEMLLELLGELVDAPAPRPANAPSWVRRAREAIDDLAPEGIEVRELAEILRVHPVSLTRAFRRVYGMPVTRYRRQVRLRRAVEQVVSTDHSLSEIAHRTGYADHPHMCRDIRAATGMTPAALRELARG